MTAGPPPDEGRPGTVPEVVAGFAGVRVLGGIVAVAVGAVILAGWLTDTQVLRLALPGDPVTTANAALALLMAGLGLLAVDRPGRAARALRLGAGASVTAIGLASLLQYLLGTGFGIDELLAADREPGEGEPGRMAPQTAVAVALVGAALLVAGRPLGRIRPARWLAAAAGGIASATLMGFLSGVHELYGLPDQSRMAPATAVALISVSVALVVASPSEGGIRILIADSPGGAHLRRLLPMILLLPFAVGVLRIAAERTGLVSVGLAVWLTVLSTTLLFLSIAWYGAERLDRLERAERMARRRASEQEARAQALLDASEDAVVLSDDRGRIIAWNASAERLFGHTAERAIGHRIDLIVPDRYRDDHETGLHRARAGAAPEEVGRLRELEAVHADGTEIPIEMTLATWTGADGRRVFGAVMRDVTARKALERAKDEFLALAAHELRTPLTSVLGYLDLVLDGDAGEVPPAQRELLGVARQRGDQLLELVSDVTTVARADAGRLTIRAETMDLVAVARTAVEAARPQAAERGLVLTLECPDDARLPVSADRTRIAQVVDNLLANALKFTPAGGAVTVGVSGDDDEVRLWVQDTGPGIPAAEQEHLFERFYRASQAVRDVVPGTGLGLAISRIIVDAHGGEIAVESVEGRGATFRVTLPAVPRGGLVRVGGPR